MHESRLLQIRGAGDEAVVLHCESVQQSRCGKIGSLEEEKVPLIKLFFVFMNTTAAIFMNSSGETFP